ncbi:MAG: TIGR03985 family CRISPR-associated protein [Spirulinaceae cyanobacterium RM2_2_10]|nr:TIGR03985 family CRISPR-associated protein [Spirulinaceae cyanobacterium RM2_2_10]
MRLWFWLHWFYGQEPSWSETLPKTYAYQELRDRLFASTHPKSDTLSAREISRLCTDGGCICHSTLEQLLTEHAPDFSAPKWIEQMQPLTGMTAAELRTHLRKHPFGTVHRSLRDDLKQLVYHGWIVQTSQGKYRCRSVDKLPTPPATASALPVLAQLAPSQLDNLLHAVESVAFVQPELDVVISALWEHAASAEPTSELKQRIFVHSDYVLGDALQTKVAGYQKQVEKLWRDADGGVVQFETAANDGSKETIVGYPVCFHYARPAKYLSIYTETSNGLGWANYRLDRLTSLKVLSWSSSDVPKPLKELHEQGELPQPDVVEAELAAAWGFEVSAPRELLVVRFPAQFASWAVENVACQPTFEQVAYTDLAKLVEAEASDGKAVASLIQGKSADDVYYRAWIRSGDPSVILQLRDWRPECEVLAPTALREQMAAEAKQELALYS